jgi:hypothetical protein
MSDTSSSSFSLKDFVVMVPAVASALALCWEVGSFLPIGGAAFSYFSITEHIAFAVPALPFAIVTAFSGYAGFLMRRSKAAGKGKLTFWIVFLVVFILSAVGAYVARTALFGALAFTAFLGLMVKLFASREIWRKATLAAGLMCLMAWALAYGVDFTRGRLNEEGSAEIVVAEGTVRAVMFRAGERGVLLYDRARHRFQFLKWDAVRSVDWDRAPIKPSRVLGGSPVPSLTDSQR